MQKRKPVIILISVLFIVMMFLFLLCPDFRAQKGEGTLLVSGHGHDLYHVFDAKSGEKIDFTSTGNEMILTSGKYIVKLHNSGPTIHIRPNKKTIVQTGVLMVTGLGINMYEVWGNDNSTKLNFTDTGKSLEMFPGEYQVKLQNVSQRVTVFENDTCLVQTGQLLVPGNEKELYDVYDENGENKLNFTFIGNPLEFLPGSYQVKYQGQSKIVVVSPGKTTVVE